MAGIGGEGRLARAAAMCECASVGPGVDAPLSEGVDDAEAGGIEPAALVGSGSEAHAGDHGVLKARSASLLVGGRLGSETNATTASQSLRISPANRGNLLFDVVPVALAVPFDAGHQSLDGVEVVAVMDPLDEAAKIAHEVATEAGTGAVIALRERQTLADEGPDSAAGGDGRGRRCSRRSRANPGRPRRSARRVPPCGGCRCDRRS